EVEQLVRSETNRVAQDVYIMCRAMQESLDQMLAYGLKVAMEVGIRQGRLDFNGPASFTWQAVNQFSGEIHRVVLPKVRYNDRWLGHNTDLTVATPLVDKVSELQGVTCTVFQRMNDAGDMLRVATTVPTLGGSRAIGTYVPHYNPDGSPNPVIETLLRGEVFSGRTYVLNAWYQTSYQPLWDASGSRVVGALYVGKKQESVTSLRRVIQDVVIGKSGYVAVFGAQGEQRGKYLISKRGQWDGENIFQGGDPKLKPFRPVIDKALSLGSDQADKVIPTLYYKYPWQNPDEADPRHKSASIAYFAPWDWIIVATAYEDDYAESQQRMASALTHMIKWIVWVAAVVIVLSLFIGYYVTRGIVRPLDEAVAVFDRIGQGQLDLQLNVAGPDEIGQLSRSFNQMVVNLKEVTASREELNHEIIERIRVENELRESEDKYRTLFNSSRDALIILDLEGRLIDGNPSALQLFGCQNKEEFTSKTPTGLSPEYQPDGALSLVKAKEMAALVMEEGSHFFEWKHQRVNGEEFFATVLVTKMHLQNKAFLQATVRDVTESKFAEEKLKGYQDHLEELVVERTAEVDKANECLQQDIMLREEVEGRLRESQKMLQLVLDYIPQYVFWKDRDSVFLGCNRNFARAAGVESPQNLVGKTDYDLVWKKEETDSYRECDRRVMESNTPELHIVESQRQADGKQAWVDTNKIPLHDGEGRVVGILGTYEDITERKMAENALRKSEKRLRAANAELEAFTYTVSHDLRTPLTVILGYAELLQKSLRDRLDEQELDSLSLIYDSGIRMVELMEDLLVLAKVGQIEQPAEPLNTREAVNDVVCGLAEIVTEAGAAVAIGALPTLRV
ncbi:MAG: Cache 3/Cache 2 fusion domain-containing protein, partial [Desulfuromonadaceae bacterium]|nr:Cache 3/Cache 2 fusion domain-containing protein [Desulfuromonadaceae bacterium]